MNSLELIEKVRDKELELGDFIYVYSGYLSEESKIGFLRYNGVEILGLENFEDDLLINPKYFFTVKSQEDVLDILDNTEKRYLNNLLKPYKQRIEHIGKTKKFNLEYIYIKLRKTKKYPREYISLPYFKAGTMYKNMELDKEYTFEDLIKF